MKRGHDFHRYPHLIKKIEYRVIWVSPPDPVKIMTEFGKIWSREHGLEFDGVYTKEGDIKQ